MTERPDELMAERLREARKRMYPTAKAASEAMGLDYPTYAGHENGSRGFSKKVKRYASFFGVSATWLLTGQGDQTSDHVSHLYHRLPKPAQDEALRYLESLTRIHSKKR